MNTPKEAPQAVHLNAERITVGEISLGDVAPSTVTDGIIALAVNAANLRASADYTVHLANDLGDAVPLQPGTLLNVWGLEAGRPSRRYIDEDRTMRTVLAHEDGTPYLPPVVLSRMASIAAAQVQQQEAMDRPKPIYLDAERILPPAAPKPQLVPDMKYTEGDMQTLHAKLKRAEEREALEALWKQPAYVTPEAGAQAAHRRPALRTRLAAGAAAITRNVLGRGKPTGRRHIRPDALRPVAPAQPVRRTPASHRRGAQEQPAAAAKV